MKFEQQDWHYGCLYSHLIRGLYCNYENLPFLRYDKERKGFWRIFSDEHYVICGFEAYNTKETSDERKEPYGSEVLYLRTLEMDDEDPNGYSEIGDLTTELLKFWNELPNDEYEPEMIYDPYLFNFAFQYVHENWDDENRLDSVGYHKYQQYRMSLRISFEYLIRKEDDKFVIVEVREENGQSIDLRTRILVETEPKERISEILRVVNDLKSTIDEPKGYTRSFI